MINYGSKFPILTWTEGLDIEQSAQQQLRNVANMPFIFKHLAVMPACKFKVLLLGKMYEARDEVDRVIEKDIS